MALSRVFTATAMAAIATGAAFGQGTSKLELDPKGAVTARLGYFPTPIELTASKPASVTKEPTYKASPKYGILHVGNGPKSDYVVALDEPENADWKIYIDKNRNGDLTDDGDGAWSKKSENGGRTVYGPMDVSLRASYGTAKKEKSSGDYTVGIYRIGGVAPLLTYRESARVGTVTLGGKSHKVLLVENDADGIFWKPAANMDEAKKTRPVWLLVDTADDGKYASGPQDARNVIEIDNQRYEPTIAPDGSSLTLSKTNKPVVELTPKAPPPPPTLKAGTPAPDFVAEKWGGGDLKLSDYKGKVVVLDFWATWCGPCQRSMPHVEKVYQSVKGQDVVVIGVCVWDEKKAYEEWVPKHQSDYSFQFAYDPAGRGANNIAGKLFSVSGIPTTYVIDKDGKVVDAIVGYDDGDTRLEQALKKVGVNAG